MVKVCRWCGGRYETQAHASRYCSTECAKRSKAERDRRRKEDAGTERARADRKRDRDYASRIMREYGITMEERQAIIDEQGGHCALCPATDSPEHRLCIDHDHSEPNKRASVRAVVCRGCNVKIARFERYLNLPRRFAG